MTTISNSTSVYRAVRIWLIVVAALIAIMVVVGGATRLTESGLSIVHWNPVIGVVPPLGHAQWEAAFNGYKQIPQYTAIHDGMTLSAFKTIFWWEWSHRLLGRVIGFVYLLPFLYFIWRGGLPSELKRRLWLIFGLGALQGAVGWWMVASGLSDRIEVSQYRLATHLVLALVIYSAIVWTARRLAERPPVAAPMRTRVTAFVLVAITFVQLYFGALVAGLRAGLVYNTWPSIDGSFIPSAARLWFETPWWRNMFDNLLTVQFEHRMTAYLLFTVVVLHAFDAVGSRAGRAAKYGAVWLLAAVTLQATLGILTLLHHVPIGLALTHQACAIVVLTLVVMQAERLAVRQAKVAPRELGVPVGQPG